MSKGKKVTIGYWYSIGLHLGLARGPLDEVVEVKAGDKIAWTGSATGNAELSIDQPNLFGGEKKEGGLVGTLKFLMGAPGQAVHPPLAAMLGGLVPAFRGVATAFWDGRVAAMNPYIKPFAFRVRRVIEGWENGAWYSARSAVWLEGNAIKAMNPAHILVQVYTDTRNGRGLPLTRLDLASFQAAADALHAEGFGLCLKFNRSDSIESFVQAILDHIGAVVFTDRATGRLKLRLLRGDYDPASLPLFDYESGLLAIDEYGSSAVADSTNEVIVRYVSPLDGEEKQVRQRNAAAIAASGGAVVSVEREYPGLPTADLAARVALRDLKSLAGGIRRLTVRLDRRGSMIDPGDVFRLSAPDIGIANMVARAGRCEYGEGTDGTVRITATQDVFGLPATAYNVPELGGFIPPDRTPRPAPRQRAIEPGYRDLLLRQGEAETLSLDPSAAFVAAMATAPNGLHTGFDVQVSTGGAFTSGVAEPGTFCPTVTLTAAVSPVATQFTVDAASSLSGVAIGSAALIGDELVRIDAINITTNIITVARGCADTIPAAHAAGDVLWCYDAAQDYGVDEREYASGSTVQVRVLPRTSSGALAVGEAGNLPLILRGRSARPYPPAYVRINGSAFPATVPANANLVLAWATRNRVTQADLLLGWTQGGVTPEAGQTTRISIYAGNDPGSLTLRKTETGLTGTSYTWTDEDADPLTPGVQRFPCIRVVIESVRDGLVSTGRWRGRHDFSSYLYANSLR